MGVRDTARPDPRAWTPDIRGEIGNEVNIPWFPRSTPPLVFLWSPSTPPFGDVDKGHRADTNQHQPRTKD